MIGNTAGPHRRDARDGLRDVRDGVNEPLWFWERGVRIFPTTNKVPDVPKGTSWNDYRATREQAALVREYGVPLGTFAVVDSDSLAAEAWNAANLPDTPFKVTTGPYHDETPGLGRHRYYLLANDAPHYIHRDGLTIEFRHRGQYVVGPGSRRPDGVIYTADDWSWRTDDVPVFPVAEFCFDDGSVQTASIGGEGEVFVVPPIIMPPRHRILFKLIRSLASHGVPFVGVRNIVRAINRQRCRPPYADAELDAYVQRVYLQKDRRDFQRIHKTGFLLGGTLMEMGLDMDHALLAIRSIDPVFDPDTQ